MKCKQNISISVFIKFQHRPIAKHQSMVARILKAVHLLVKYDGMDHGDSTVIFHRFRLFTALGVFGISPIL